MSGLQSGASIGADVLRELLRLAGISGGWEEDHGTPGSWVFVEPYGVGSYLPLGIPVIFKTGDDDPPTDLGVSDISVSCCRVGSDRGVKLRFRVNATDPDEVGRSGLKKIRVFMTDGSTMWAAVGGGNPRTINVPDSDKNNEPFQSGFLEFCIRCADLNMSDPARRGKVYIGITAEDRSGNKRFIPLLYTVSAEQILECCTDSNRTEGTSNREETHSTTPNTNTERLKRRPRRVS